MRVTLAILAFTALPVCCLFQNLTALQVTGGSPLVCERGFTLCDNGTNCYSNKLNCDNEKDCQDGSDETGCQDRGKNEYWDHIFKKRRDEDREEKMRTCDLGEIPRNCTCSAKELYCTHTGLPKVPPDLSPSLELLDLTGNSLGSISYDDFPQLENCTELIMIQAKVRNLGEDVFRRMPSLGRAYLAGNLLAKLQDDVFATSTVLYYLDLSYNPLSALSANTFRGLSSLDELKLRNCRLRSLPSGVFDPLLRLTFLWLDGNHFEEIPQHSFWKLNRLLSISLTGNKLRHINSDIFRKNRLLRLLSLSNNKLTYLTGNSFGNLSNLHSLDLSHNNIDSIEVTTFSLLKNLQSLDLRGNPLRDLTSAVFDGLDNLKHIYFDDFKYCSYAVHAHVCHPRGDGISSAEHLLDKVVLRIFVWIMASVSCIGNFFVMIGRVLFKEPNEVHSFYIKNLSLADLLMGVYLFIIASYDIAFRGIYMKNQLFWMSSWQCQLCGFISTLSSEASVLVLTVITIDRYVSIQYPLASQRRNWSSAMVYMIGAWVTAVVLASLPLFKLDYFGTEFYGNNGMCLPLHIHHPYARAWEYSTFMFCGINAAAFVLIVYAYISMFLTISRSKSGLRSTQQQQDNAVVKRFAFIIGTDFICWVPIIGVKLVAFTNVDIPVDLYAWIAVFFLPINSALNPVLYTLTTKLFKQHLSKLMHNLHPFHDFSTKSFSSIFYNRSSKRSYFGTLSENDHSYSSRSSQLQSRKSSSRNGTALPIPHPV